MKPTEFALLLLLGAIWGASFIFIRVAAPVLGPLLLMDARVGLAGITLLLYALIIGKAPHLAAHWREFLILGATNAGIPFALIAFSTLYLTGSFAAILNSTTPLFTAVVAAYVLGEPLNGKRVVGVLMGITGVAVLVGGSPLEINVEKLVAVAASLLAALSYACGSVYAKRTFSGISSLHMAIGQLFGATLTLLIPALVSIPEEAPSGEAVFSLIALALLCTAFAYMIYFHLLREVGATKTVSVTFLVPAFGILWGRIFLNEPLSVGMFIGLGFILLSIILVTEVRLPQRLLVRSYA